MVRILNAIFLGPIKKNKYASGSGSENFRQGRHTYFLSVKFFILCILKGISPFKIQKIIFSSGKPKKMSRFHL